jgi:multidrug efflux system membrane fusion protein
VFANEGGLLMPGMFAKVRVPAGPPRQSLFVPAVAVGSEQGRKYVYVLNEDGTVDKRLVTVGRQHGPDQAIREGLTEKDQVVVNGLLMLRPGIKVNVKPPDAGAAPASPAQPPRKS